MNKSHVNNWTDATPADALSSPTTAPAAKKPDSYFTLAGLTAHTAATKPAVVPDAVTDTSKPDEPPQPLSVSEQLAFGASESVVAARQKLVSTQHSTSDWILYMPPHFSGNGLYAIEGYDKLCAGSDRYEEPYNVRDADLYYLGGGGAPTRVKDWRGPTLQFTYATRDELSDSKFESKLKRQTIRPGSPVDRHFTDQHYKRDTGPKHVYQSFEPLPPRRPESAVDAVRFIAGGGSISATIALPAPVWKVSRRTRIRLVNHMIAALRYRNDNASRAWSHAGNTDRTVLAPYELPLELAAIVYEYAIELFFHAASVKEWIELPAEASTDKYWAS